MIEKLNGNGQGCCELCCLVKGWHREWTSSLYHLRNRKGLLLRKRYDYYPTYFFSNDEDFPPVSLCYAHALFTDETRKYMTDYNKGEVV